MIRPEETEMETTETIREPRRLSRPRDGRWLGGVSAALGAYFDLSPAIYRIAFVALALAGGTGILLYVAAWLVIPGEGEEDSIAAAALKRNRERPSRAVGTVSAAPPRRPLFPLAAGVLLVVVGTVALVDLLGAWNADWRIVLGALVVATGGLVAAGAATGRSVASVIGLGLLLAALLVVAVAIRVPLFVGIGDRVEHP